MKGQNCEARFSYRGFATATTTAEIVQNSLVVAQLVLTPSTDPRIASINFPCGDLANATTFRIAQTTANMTGTNEIGGVYTGLATNMANVAQAEAVGGYKITARVTRPSTTSATFANLSGGSSTQTLFGKATSSDSASGSVTFSNLPSGNYMIAYTNHGNSATSTSCEYQWYEDTSGVVSGYQYLANDAGWSMPTGYFEFTTAASRTFRIQGKRFGTNNCTIDHGINAQIVVYRFPTSSELVVTPERQNTFGYISGTGIDYSTKSGTFVTPSGFTMDPGYGKCIADGTNVACKIETLPPGSYDVTVSAPMLSVGGSSGNQSCYWGISDGVQVDVALAQSLTPVQSGSYDAISSVSRQFTYTSTQTNRIFKLIVREAGSGGASSNCAIPASTNRYWAMKVTPLNQPSNSALFVEGPVKASATGAAIPEGYVNEFATRRITDTANRNVSVALGAWYYPWSGTLTLPAGNWNICYRVAAQMFQNRSAVNVTQWYTRIHNQTDDTTIMANLNWPTYDNNTTHVEGSLNTHSGCQPISITSSKVFRVGLLAQPLLGVPTGVILALRGDLILSELYAIRLN
jgi:hypothetical protein